MRSESVGATPLPTSLVERRGRERGSYFNAVELLSESFAEPRWAVPDLVPEGLTLLAGAPKVGKSWFSLGLAVAVASGCQALGCIPVERGVVLYAALEDTPRRLQERLNQVLGQDRVPDTLMITTEMPKLPEAEDWLRDWLKHHPSARLVIVDVLRKIRPTRTGSRNPYDEDYDVLSALKKLADEFKVALVVVHHTRKARDRDVFNEVSGSTGLTGSADAVLVLKRARNASEATLSVTGRDIMEREHLLTFSEDTARWRILEPLDRTESISLAQRTIFQRLEAVPGGTPTEIVVATGLPPGTVKSGLHRMVEKGIVHHNKEGGYVTSVEPGTVGTMEPLKGRPEV